MKARKSTISRAIDAQTPQTHVEVAAASPGVAASSISHVGTGRLQSFTINHDRFQRSFELLDRCRASYTGDRRPRNMQIYGITGVGKTTLLTAYAKAHPPLTHEHGKEVPVLSCTIPGTPTIRSVATRLLEALGAPSPTSGTAEMQMDRFIMLARAAKVRLIILDEFHHFIDRGSARSHAAAADNLKVLLDRLKVPCVVAGAPRMKKLFDLNAQFRNRFLLTHHIRPMSIRNEDGLAELMGVLEALKAQTAPSMSPLLSDPAFAVACFYATDGIFRTLIDLVEAIDDAVLDGAEASMETAELVFADVIWSDASAETNPFSPNFIPRRLNLLGEPYEPSLYDGDNHPLDADCMPRAA